MYIGIPVATIIQKSYKFCHNKSYNCYLYKQQDANNNNNNNTKNTNKFHKMYI